MKAITILFIIVLLAACKGKTAKKENVVADTISKPAQTPVIAGSDTLIIDNNAAVYYIPDSARMEKWKKQVGEKDFETVADDWSFYMNEATGYIKTTRLPLHDASGKKVLKFIKTGGAVTMVGLDTLSNFWGFYLFNPGKEPQFADIVTMDRSYKDYFK